MPQPLPLPHPADISQEIDAILLATQPLPLPHPADIAAEIDAILLAALEEVEMAGATQEAVLGRVQERTAALLESLPDVPQGYFEEVYRRSGMPDQEPTAHATPRVTFAAKVSAGECGFWEEKSRRAAANPWGEDRRRGAVRAGYATREAYTRMDDLCSSHPYGDLEGKHAASLDAAYMDLPFLLGEGISQAQGPDGEELG